MGSVDDGLQNLDNILNKGKDDFENDLKKIEEEINCLDIIKQSIADNRGIHREYLKKLGINTKLQELGINIDGFLNDNMVNSNTNNIIIRLYTFFEQLLKCFLFKILFGEIKSEVAKYYLIQDRFNPNKYFPDIKLKRISEELKKIYKGKKIDLFLKFLTQSDSNLIKNKYDELRKMRNQYSHTGGYRISFEIKDFRLLINIAKYFVDEYFIIIENYEERGILQDNLNELESKLKSFKCAESSKQLEYMKEIKCKLDKSIKLFDKLKCSSEIYKNLCDTIKCLRDKLEEYISNLNVNCFIEELESNKWLKIEIENYL